MTKYVYPQKMSFNKYDDNHIIGFLNEKVIENYQQEGDGDNKPEPYTGYQYEGPESDGSTIMECKDPKSRDDVINAIIRSKYSETEEFAIQRHYANDSETYAEEWKAYNEWCEYAKTTGTSWLS